MGKNGKTPSVETILRPGQILDHKYRVEKLLGLGGMAAVWVGVNRVLDWRHRIPAASHNRSTRPHADRGHTRDSRGGHASPLG